MSSNSIFRKSSLDRVTSPEQLNDYIKVTRPSLWLVLGAVIALLIGVIIWGVLGTLATVRQVPAVVKDGKAVCYVTPELAENITPGMEVRIGENEGKIISIATAPVEATESMEAYALYLSGLQAGDFVVPVTGDISVSDGIYMADIVLEAISPISFLLN